MEQSGEGAPAVRELEGPDSNPKATGENRGGLHAGQ